MVTAVPPLMLNASDTAPMVSALAVTAGASDLVVPSGPQRPTRGLLVGGAGTITVTMADGSSVVITPAVGVMLPLQVTKVTAATATLIVAFW